MTERTGCQLRGALERLLEHKPLYNAEIDALQRRLFAFPEELNKLGLNLQDIRDIRTQETAIYFMGYLRNIYNEFDTGTLDQLFD